MSTERKSVAEMIAEFFREAALLVGVFMPLDMLFYEKAIPKPILAFGVSIFLLCLVFGIVIERLR